MNRVKPKTAFYLGDGLYVTYDGFHIRLFAERGSGTHEVFMDDEVLKTFELYVKTLRERGCIRAP